MLLSTLLCELGLFAVATALSRNNNSPWVTRSVCNSLGLGRQLHGSLVRSMPLMIPPSRSLTIRNESRCDGQKIRQLQRRVGVHKHPVRGAVPGAAIAAVAGTTINAAAGTAYQIDCETLCGPGGIEIAEIATIAVVGAVVGLVVDAVGDNREWKALQIPASGVPP